jgi:hypothetical protein
LDCVGTTSPNLHTSGLRSARLDRPRLLAEVGPLASDLCHNSREMFRVVHIQEILYYAEMGLHCWLINITACLHLQVPPHMP